MATDEQALRRTRTKIGYVCDGSSPVARPTLSRTFDSKKRPSETALLTFSPFHKERERERGEGGFNSTRSFASEPRMFLDPRSYSREWKYRAHMTDPSSDPSPFPGDVFVKIKRRKLVFSAGNGAPVPSRTEGTPP